MDNLDFNFLATVISIISICIAAYACYQNYKINKEALRSYVYLYVVSTKNATYIKVKNFGKTSAKIIGFNTDINVNEARQNSKFPDYFPLVGLTNIHLAPNASKIALIENKYLNCKHWMSVTYIDEISNKTYVHKIELISFGKYALVDQNDFEIIDY